MDKQQIIEVIKQNPQMSYEEMKNQAESAGVSLELMDEAWNEVGGQKKKGYKKILFFIISILIITILVFGFKFILKTDGAIIEYNSGLKTFEDCINIAEKEVANRVSDYKLLSVTLYKLRENKNISAPSCNVIYLGGNGEYRTDVYIDKMEIQIQKSSDRESKLTDVDFNNLVSSPEIMKLSDFLKSIQKHPDFYNDLQVALEEQGNLNAEDIIAANTVLFMKEYNKYVWLVVIHHPDIVDRYYFDAISGEFIEKESK